MTTYFVSRHPGAIEWACRKALAIDRFVPHFDPAPLHKGDVVIGTLPVHQAARVCALGARYVHLALDLPAEMRGRELSADQIESFGARLDAFDVNLSARQPEFKS